MKFTFLIAYRGMGSHGFPVEVEADGLNAAWQTIVAKQNLAQVTQIQLREDHETKIGSGSILPAVRWG